MDKEEIIQHMNRIIEQLNKIKSKVQLLDRLRSRPPTGKGQPEKKTAVADIDMKQLQEELDSDIEAGYQFNDMQQQITGTKQEVQSRALRATLKNILISSHHHDSKSTILRRNNSNLQSTVFLQDDEELAAQGLLASPGGSNTVLPNL